MGPVLNDALGEEKCAGSGVFGELKKGLNAIKEAGWAVSGDFDPVRADREAVALGAGFGGSARGGAVADGEKDGVWAGAGGGFEVESVELGEAGGKSAGGDAGFASDGPGGVKADVAWVERDALGRGDDGVPPEEEVAGGRQCRDRGGQEQAEKEEEWRHGRGVLSGLWSAWICMLRRLTKGVNGNRSKKDCHAGGVGVAC